TAVLVVAALAILRRIRALGLPAFCDIPVGRRIRANCCLCSLTSFGRNEHGGSPSVSSANQHHGEPARPNLWTVRDTIALRLDSSSHYCGFHLCAALGSPGCSWQAEDTGRASPRDHCQLACELLSVHSRSE